MKKSTLVIIALTAVISIIGLGFVYVMNSDDIKLHPEGISSQMHSKGAYGPVSGTGYRSIENLPEEIKSEPSISIQEK